MSRSFWSQFGIAYGTAEIGPADQWPITVQVSEEMRACSAAILVFTGGQELEPSWTQRRKKRCWCWPVRRQYCTRAIRFVDRRQYEPAKKFRPFASHRVRSHQARAGRPGLLREFNARHALKLRPRIYIQTSRSPSNLCQFVMLSMFNSTSCALHNVYSAKIAQRQIGEGT